MANVSKKKTNQSRSWVLTLSAEKFDREAVEAGLASYTYVGQLERGLEKTDNNLQGYLHWQIYIENPGPIKFETLQRKFPGGHFEVRKGTRKQAYAYCTKKETSEGELISRGEINVKDDEKGTTVDDLRLMMLEEGKPLRDLLVEEAACSRHVMYLTQLEGELARRKWGATTRDVKVSYLYGPPGVGKTHGVFEAHGFEDVFSVSSWKNPWDSYAGQRVLLLDEFAGQLEFEFLLKLLDRYPLQLPARYADRWAAFDEVVLLSNLPLTELYRDVQERRPEQWGALKRRISSYQRLDERGGVPVDVPL